MKKAALILGVVISFALVGFGQRTVTNSTLEKFQQKRLAAERDYRENYLRMGFPSPEELDRQRDADMAARIQIADQLRQARLEKERVELERHNLDLEAAAFEDSRAIVENGNGIYGGFSGGYSGGFYNDGRRHRRFRGRYPISGGYRATPVGVYPNPRPSSFKSFSSGRRHRGGGAIIRSGRR